MNTERCVSFLLRHVAAFVVCTLVFPAGCRRERDRAGDARADKASSIVLITLDTTRADHLGCYGYFRDTSPTLDAVAAESIVFERCLAPMAQTLPSHVTLFTGTNPSEHGVLANIEQGAMPFVTSPALKSFAQLAEAAGYQTAGFVSAVPLKRYSGAHKGFATWSEPGATVRQRRAADTNAEVFHWLDSRPPGTYFLWVHYFDPHFPYEPPHGFNRYTTDARLEAFLRERGLYDTSVIPESQAVEARSVNNLYDGEIRYLDEQIRLLLERLGKLPDWSRTVLIIVGDHGEGLFQHGEALHGSTWDEQLHVPLIVRIPGERARRVSMAMGVVDVFPTVIPIALRTGFEELLSQASGRNVLDAGYQPPPVFSQLTGRKRADKPFPTYTATTERWKFTHEVGGVDRLFNLATDPHELRNVLAENDDVARQLRDYILRRIAEGRIKAAVYQAGRAAPAPLDPRVLEQLRSLGYLAGDEDEHEHGDPAPVNNEPADSGHGKDDQ